MKKLSILIPVFNGENTIVRCIESIPKKYDDVLDIHILNDGSTDKTKELISSLNRKSITIINQQNKGIAKSREFLISLVKTKYFIFIDSDDFFIKKNFKNIINKLDEDFDICLFKTIIKKRNKYYKWGQINFFESSISKTINNSFIPFWNILFSKKYIDKIDLKIEHEKCEDWGVTDFIFSLASKIEFVDEYTMVYDKTFSVISTSWKNIDYLLFVLCKQFNNLFNQIDIRILKRKIDWIFTYLILKILLLKNQNFLTKIKTVLNIKNTDIYKLLKKVKKPNFLPIFIFLKFRDKKITKRKIKKIMY